MTVVLVVALGATAVPAGGYVSGTPTDVSPTFEDVETCGGTAPEETSCSFFVLLSGTNVIGARADSTFIGTVEVWAREFAAPGLPTTSHYICEIGVAVSSCVYSPENPPHQSDPFIRGEFYVWAEADGIGSWEAYVSTFEAPDLPPSAPQHR